MSHTLKKIAGIDCLFIPMESSNSTTIQILVKAGSVYESKELNGISHFLEHMFFKGSKHYPTAKIQSQSIENFGGEVNAFTSNEYAWYYIKSAPIFTSKSLDILADMIINPLFPIEEMEKEKWVVIQEISMYEDNPAKLVRDLSDFAFLWDNNFWRPILWTEKNVQNFTQAELFAHKESLYTKDNMIIVISGKIEQQASLEKQIAMLFENVAEKNTWIKTPFVWKFPEKKEDCYKKWTEQNHLIISAMGFNGTKKERYAAKTLWYILGGNMSSRLFQEIREKEGLCYYIHAGHGHSIDYGTFTIRAGIQKDKFNFGKEKIYTELEKISTWDVTQQELDNIQWYLRGSIQMSMETSDEVGYFLGLQHLLYGKIESITEMLQHYEVVTLEEVNTVAKKLSKENLFCYWIE